MGSLQRNRFSGQRVGQHFAARRSPGRLYLGRRDGGGGRVIPHASGSRTTTAATIPFSIPVVEPAFGALPMATTGTAKALGAACNSALRAAVEVPAIALAADAEQLLTTRAAIDSQRSRMGGHGIRRGPEISQATTFPNHKNMRQSGAVELVCLFIKTRSSSTRGPGVGAPGPHL